MHAKELLEMERRDIRALHYTWIAFFLTFYVWFNMAPLATSMLQTESYLTPDHIKLFLIANVALTIPLHTTLIFYEKYYKIHLKYIL